MAANGGSGWASWTALGDGSFAHYAYTLPNDGSYALHVGCGGTTSNWRMTTYSGYVGGTVNNFTCFDSPGYGYGNCLNT